MSRAQQLKSIEERLRGQRLIWFGTRGTDAAPLLPLQAFSGVVCLTSPLDLVTRVDFSESALELISRERVDLDVYRLDQDHGEHARILFRRLLLLLRKDTALAAYRPCDFLSAAYFPRLGWATYLGMFAAHGAAYDHKPWVESGLKSAGVPVIPWQYFHDEELPVLAEVMSGRAYVLRANYSDGGAGLTFVPPGADPLDHIPAHTDGFLAATPLLTPNVPLNTSGCVYPDGTTIVRAPSVQLIGIDCCTTRKFGYCGNDFAAVASTVDSGDLDILEMATKAAGCWLHSTGYLGAFGVDALVSEGRVFITEVNPRFQGCSSSAAAMAARLDTGDIYLDHLGVFLGLDPPTDVAPLREQASDQADAAAALSQIVCHNTTGSVRVANGSVIQDVRSGRLNGVPEEGIRVVPEGMLFKVLVDRAVTDDGANIDSEMHTTVETLAGRLFADVPS